ncbi:MAG: epoxyqueuosine reductase QueH [Clostridia bacterium]|nr:epoxyqueuosine reductase QueH [Clostridia bacterium]
MKKLLLHSCCGPCSSGVIGQVVKDFDVTILFYNPNIQPNDEYLKRLEAQKTIIDKMNSEYGYNVKLIEVDYNPQEFFEVAKGLELEKEGGARCEKCFYLRLDKTASFAKANGYDTFTTTLSISPHKDFELLNKIGKEMSDKHGVDYMCANFKKNDGYLNSIKNSKKYEIYRQNYCGCIYSKKESEEYLKNKESR